MSRPADMTPLTDQQKKLAEKHYGFAIWFAEKWLEKHEAVSIAGISRIADEVYSAAGLGLIKSVRAFRPGESNLKQFIKKGIALEINHAMISIRPAGYKSWKASTPPSTTSIHGNFDKDDEAANYESLLAINDEPDQTENIITIISSLKAKWRKAALRSWVDRAKYATIARELGVTREAVRRQIMRARKELASRKYNWLNEC